MTARRVAWQVAPLLLAVVIAGFVIACARLAAPGQVLAANLAGPSPAGNPPATVTTTPGGVPVSVWLPNTPCPCPTLVLTLGVAPLPATDPQVQRLASSLATSGGLRVVIAEPADLANALITEPAIDDLAEVLDWGGTLDPGQPVSAAGFSAGASLMALAIGRAEVTPPAFFWFGGFADAPRLLDALLCTPPAEGFAPDAWAIQLGTIQVETAGSAPAAWCDGTGRPDAFAGIAPERPSAVAALARTRVYLLHDEGDPYVPVEETRRMAQALAAAGVPHQVVLSQVFEHVTPGDITPGSILDLVRITLLLGDFLDASRRLPGAG